MLVPFAIDSGALVADPPYSDFDLLEAHESLLTAWKQIGLLVIDGDYASTSALRLAIDAVPKGSVLHSRWRDFVLRAPTLVGGEKWRGVLNELSAPTLRELARVCFTSSSKRTQYQGTFSDANFELRSIWGVGGCRTFNRAIASSESHIREGERVEEIWSNRFSALAAATAESFKLVRIIDRYIIGRHLNESKGELTRFLKLLSATARKKKHVSVYTSRPIRDQLKWSDAEIAAQLRPMRDELQNIASLTIQIVSNWDVRKSQKDRFVMFGDNYVWDLGHGLEPFEHATVQSNCSASLKTWESTNSYRKILDGLTSPKQIRVWE